MKIVPEEFGKLVFNETAMHKALKKEVFEKLEQTIKKGESLDSSLAHDVAEAMKDWAIANGATHYTHWFQPLTGITAEKHESFLTTVSSGNPILELSGKELIKGEPDASSFPSGGLRSTFEARGYTAWDPTSFAFIKGNTLCIPTAFCSYGGHALDKKTPLLRSIEALNKQALRLFKVLKMNDVNRIVTNVGPEQEYFLVDKAVFEKRLDLVLTGRTLFGAPSPKGQELDDHYFGCIKERVAKFMEELDIELWKLGVLAKTEHNEVAPAQHELAPIYCDTNSATDQNQLTMELMKKVAGHHDMACLLHEKPFKGVNGSGKHNNWSMSSDSGENLFDPGSTPEDNLQFLLFLTAVIKAVDEYQDLLRMTVATAGNDHRLGANEAPTPIVTLFLGEELTGILDAIAEGRTYSKRARCEFEMGVSVLPKFLKDTTDRNRTSPFAFTGNKFEFRMPGSSLSISGPNIIINTIVAEELRIFADELENADDFNEAVKELIKQTIIAHRRIIFNGNSYDKTWPKEAEKRGLLCLKSAPDAIPCFTYDKNVEVFERHNVFTRTECESRAEILLENYCKTLDIEALTMIQMAQKDILPAVTTYINEVMQTIINAEKFSFNLDLSAQKALLENLTALYNSASKKVEDLQEARVKANRIKPIAEHAQDYRKYVFNAMEELRKDVDALEMITASKYWPDPSYGDILFSIR